MFCMLLAMNESTRPAMAVLSTFNLSSVTPSFPVDCLS